MVGLDGAGKTTILYKLALDEVVSTIPTVGLNIENIVYKDCKLMVYDLGGQRKMRRMWSNYFDDIDAIIFVVDSNESNRVNEVKDDNAKQELYKLLSDERLSDAVLLIMANKQDLPHAINTNEMVQRLALEQHLNQERLWHIQETCATSGDGLFEALDWLSNVLAARPSTHKRKKKSKRKQVVQNTHRSPLKT